MAPTGSANGAGVVRDQLSDLRGLLVLSMLLTRQDDEAGILHLVASAVESLGPCWTERIFLDGHWAEVRVPAHERRPRLAQRPVGRARRAGTAGRCALVVGLPHVDPAWPVRLPGRRGRAGAG